MSKSASWVIRVLIAYVISSSRPGLAAWGPGTDNLWFDTLIADLIATLVIFGFSRTHKNSSFYDAYWSVIPPLLLVFWWSQAPDVTDCARAWFVTIVVIAWAIRLTANWMYAFPGLHHEDWRYPMLREQGGRAEFFVDLFAIHLIPTGQVFLGMLPMYVAVTRGGARTSAGSTSSHWSWASARSRSSSVPTCRCTCSCASGSLAR